MILKKTENGFRIIIKLLVLKKGIFMENFKERKVSNIKEDPRVYLAVERTFLAWIRTAIAFLAFGIAIEKFDFFIRTLELSYHISFSKISTLHHLGKILIFVGLLTLIFGKLNFWLSLRRLERDVYQTAKHLYIIYAILVGLIALGLLISFFMI